MNSVVIILTYLLMFSNSQCLDCHNGVVLSGVHKDMECTACHADIQALPHKDVLKKVKCGNCHDDILSIYRQDVHYRLRASGKKGIPDCKDCHGTHSILSPSNKKSPLSPLRKRAFCTKCHKNVIAPVVYHAAKINEKKCLECHDEEIRSDLKGSVHSVLTCSDCHREVRKIPHPESLSPPECGLCHKNEYMEHAKSIHGKAIKEGIIEAAHCYDCHGSHSIVRVEDKRSPVYYVNLVETCGKCHGKQELNEKYKIPVKNPYQLYKQSVHYQKILEGEKAATCSDCHGVHNIDTIVNPGSKINKANVPKTCSKCHEKEYKAYSQSIHYKAFLKGVLESPVCNDCHLEHRILPPDNPESPVYPFNVPKTCTECHERYTLVERYGITPRQLSAFYGSYHGLALKAGNIAAANCASCHNNHLILPSSDPLSPVNPKNLPKTCGKCHPKIKVSAQIKSFHNVMDPLGGFIINIVRKVYIYLIIVTIGGMLIYCLLDLIKKAREGVRAHFSESTRDLLRFNKFERGVHLVHLISFVILVYTGFIHRYPDAFWGHWLAQLNNGAVRDYLHRIAGSLMIIAFGITVFGMVFTERGRAQFLEIFLKPKDIKDAIQLLLYNLGWAKERPKFGRFTFYEKIEFWALVWGTIVMGITGVALWFKSYTLNLLPNWFIDLFLVIHYYEAILASLAILIWHFYWVIFDPVFYPLNKAMFTGTVPEEIYKEEHPLEFESKETF